MKPFSVTTTPVVQHHQQPSSANFGGYVRGAAVYNHSSSAATPNSNVNLMMAPQNHVSQFEVPGASVETLKNCDPLNGSGNLM